MGARERIYEAHIRKLGTPATWHPRPNTSLPVPHPSAAAQPHAIIREDLHVARVQNLAERNVWRGAPRIVACARLLPPYLPVLAARAHLPRTILPKAVPAAPLKVPSLLRAHADRQRGCACGRVRDGKGWCVQGWRVQGRARSRQGLTLPRQPCFVLYLAFFSAITGS